jgi:S1-C subfamily serine protease
VTHRGSDPAAATVGLRTGDIITAVNGQPIAALAGLQLLYDRASVGAELVLTVTRNSTVIEIRFPKPASP